MANPAQRLPSNVTGDFFVDSTCIDCDQCREIAPEVFHDAEDHASVFRQPESPTRVPAVASFPERIEDNVYFCGFAAESSFGASSYLIVRPEGNVLVDSPRFAGRLGERIEGAGGVRA